MNTTLRYELALIETDGSYTLMGDFATEAEAIDAAKANGPGEYAYTSDPAGGHYESTLTVEGQ